MPSRSACPAPRSLAHRPLIGLPPLAGPIRIAVVLPSRVVAVVLHHTHLVDVAVEVGIGPDAHRIGAGGDEGCLTDVMDMAELLGVNGLEFEGTDSDLSGAVAAAAAETAPSSLRL